MGRYRWGKIQLLANPNNVLQLRLVCVVTYCTNLLLCSENTKSSQHEFHFSRADDERFLEYQYKPPVAAGSSNARYDKVLQRYLTESQRRNSPDVE